jgi:hypothetical protein
MTEFGQRHGALLSPLPRPRLAAAVLVLGAAFAGAAILLGLRVRFVYPGPAGRASYPRPEWVGPVALGLCVLGLSVAAGLLFAPRLRRMSRLRLAVAALILGLTVVGSSLVGVAGRGPLICNAPLPASYRGPPCFRNGPGNGLLDAAALALCTLGVAGAAGVLTTRRAPRHPE